MNELFLCTPDSIDYLELGTPRENVVAMIEAAKDEGRY